VKDGQISHLHIFGINGVFFFLEYFFVFNTMDQFWLLASP
jgi:hypothetical protein